MNKICKTLMVGAIATMVLMGMVAAQPPMPKHGNNHRDPASKVATEEPLAQPPMMQGHKHKPMSPQTTTFETCKVVYTRGGFVMINEVDNAIDIVERQADSMVRVARYQVDQHKGRHDINKILRPVSIALAGGEVMFLATSEDSSYIGLLPLPLHHRAMEMSRESGVDEMSGATLPAEQNEGEGLVEKPRCDKACNKKFEPIATRGIGSHSDGFNYNRRNGELIVVGFNPTGYDINIMNLGHHAANIANAEATTFHYHVPKQAERIKDSDPYGVGLTVVAVLVVFLALMIIAIVLKYFGLIVHHIQKHRKEKKIFDTLSHTIIGTDDEVYAAIATALYMYESEMHDDEETVLTIQKVERAWTPWNAKFYNMNQYSNRKGR